MSWFSIVKKQYACALGFVDVCCYCCSLAKISSTFLTLSSGVCFLSVLFPGSASHDFLRESKPASYLVPTRIEL